MKKKMFSLILAMLLVMIPMGVHAADFSGSVFGAEDEAMNKTTLNSSSITCPKSATGDTATCYIGIRVTSGTAKNFSVTATLTNMTYDSIEAMNGWTYTTPVTSGNTITFNFTNRTGLAATNQVLVAKVTYNVNNRAQECGIRITSTNATTPETPQGCRVENNKYYCQDGEECSKAEYDEKCVPSNPQTGSFVPYVVVLGGLGVAGALYFTTRKKAKIYHV